MYYTCALYAYKKLLNFILFLHCIGAKFVNQQSLNKMATIIYTETATQPKIRVYCTYITERSEGGYLVGSWVSLYHTGL